MKKSVVYIEYVCAWLSNFVFTSELDHVDHISRRNIKCANSEFGESMPTLMGNYSLICIYVAVSNSFQVFDLRSDRVFDYFFRFLFFIMVMLNV